MKKKKKKMIHNFIHSLKPILIFSFIINIILLSYVYYLKNAHHTYLFTGYDEYLSMDSGVINLNYDINLLEGNGIEYIGEEDYKIKEIKIGYYVMEDEKLLEITSYYEKFTEFVSLKETIESINTFNISEVADKGEMFKNINKDNIESSLYIIMEATTEDSETIVSKLLLDVSKVN